MLRIVFLEYVISSQRHAQWSAIAYFPVHQPTCPSLTASSFIGAMASRLWVVSAPNERQSSSFESIYSSLDSSQALCSAHRLVLPQLRVGTLDSLISVADAISRDDKTLESSIDRVLRQYRELVNQSSAIPQVEGVEILEYVTDFEWDEAKFASTDSLAEIRSCIMDQVSRLEDDMKIRSNDYTTIRQALTSIERRWQGNLMTRSLATIIEAEHVIDTEHMATAFLVFPSYDQPNFISTYEQLADYVVPRSAQKISSDSELVLYGVTVFRKSLEQFKAACRENRYTVRDFKFDPNAKTRSAEEEDRLKEEAEEQLATFSKWAETAFAETFIAMVHLKALRAFAESVLRYGLPVNFDVSILIPNAKSDTRLRAALNEMFGHLGGSWAAVGDEEVGHIPGIVGDKEFYPYVYFDIPLPAGKFVAA